MICEASRPAKTTTPAPGRQHRCEARILEFNTMVRGQAVVRVPAIRIITVDPIGIFPMKGPHQIK